MGIWNVLGSPAWGALESVGTAVAVGVAAWAARQANATAATVAEIESKRRHTELCPVLRVVCEPFSEGSEVLRLRVMLMGPPGLDRIDRLTATIRNDHFRRGENHQQFLDGPTEQEIKEHIWGPYRFTPGTGPDDARADGNGRETVYRLPLPLGEELPYQLEPTSKGRWMTGMTQADWLRQRGTVIRLAFRAEHEEHGAWYLPCELDTATTPATPATTNLPQT